jgi:hypothetical protein
MFRHNFQAIIRRQIKNFSKYLQLQVALNSHHLQNNDTNNYIKFLSSFSINHDENQKLGVCFVVSSSNQSTLRKLILLTYRYGEINKRNF